MLGYEPGYVVAAFRRNLLKQLESSPADGCIAGTPADVPVEGGDQVLRIGKISGKQEAGDRKDKSGGTKPALGGRMVHKCLLNRRQLIAVLSFDGHNVAVPDIAEGGETRYDGFIS